MNKRSLSRAEIERIISVLEMTSKALSASHNLTVTDRPDLPLEEQPFYVLDHMNETNAIGELLLSLGDLANTDSDHECDLDNKCL